MPLSRCFPSQERSSDSSRPSSSSTMTACALDSYSSATDGADLGSYAHLAAGYQPDSNHSTVDDLLTKEMNQLTVKERDDLYEEIHGIQGTLKPETPEFLEDIYVKLDRSFALLPNNKRKAYDRAIFLKPSLQYDRTFQLIFLRFCKYQTAQAATQISNYFQHKLTLFGEAKLTKKITLDDLSDDDVDSLERTRCSFLPRSDRSGRSIFWVDLFNLHFKAPENYVRQAWYHMMVASEREDIQMNGVVAIHMALGENRTGLLKLMEVTNLAGSVVACLPVRIISTHLCTDNPRVVPVVKAFQVLAGKEYRMRSRAHFGSRIEVQYALMTFGIKLPDSLMNDIPKGCKDAMEDFIQERRRKEVEVTHDEILPEGICRLFPTPQDILCGRGRPYHSYMGNLALQKTVEAELPRYLSTVNRMEKTSINAELVGRTQGLGGRFLKRAAVGWEEADDLVARAKIGEMMRQARLKLGKQEGHETTSPSHSSHPPQATTPSIKDPIPFDFPWSADVDDVNPMDLLSFHEPPLMTQENTRDKKRLRFSTEEEEEFELML